MCIQFPTILIHLGKIQIKFHKIQFEKLALVNCYRKVVFDELLYAYHILYIFKVAKYFVCGSAGFKVIGRNNISEKILKAKRACHQS